MNRLTLRLLHLREDRATVLAEKEITITEHDAEDSLLQSIKEEFELSSDTKLYLFHELPKFDPSDPTAYQKISPKAVIGATQLYLSSRDVSKLFVPLENGKLELAFTVKQASPHHAGPAGQPRRVSGGSSSHTMR